MTWLAKCRMMKEAKHELAVVAFNTESAILARITQAGGQEVTPDMARYFLSMRLTSSDEDRVNELSAKAGLRSLTEAETQELDSYLHIRFLLGIMQAKGRCLLDPETTAARH